ncbi:MAG: hypothetical protein GY765_18125 [bacterium]|nr:hypothetical protein [bacterium]
MLLITACCNLFENQTDIVREKDAETPDVPCFEGFTVCRNFPAAFIAVSI